PSRILRVTPADLAPPSLDRPLYGRIQPIEEPPPSKMATPGSLVEQGLANLLYQHALAGIVQPAVIVPPSNIVRVPFAELTPWIQYPLAGVFQDVAVFDPSKIVHVTTADIPPTPLSPFLQPLAGRDQFDQPRVSVSLLIGTRLPIIVQVPFELFQRPLIAIPRPSFDDGQLEDISVI